MSARAALAAVAIVTALSGCGQDPVGTQGSEALVAGVARVSQAATAGDATALDAAAGALREAVTTGLAAGALDDARAAAVLDQLDRVLADVAATSPSPSPAPAPTTTSPAPRDPPASERGGKDDDGKDDDKDDDEGGPGKKGESGRDDDD